MRLNGMAVQVVRRNGVVALYNGLTASVGRQVATLHKGTASNYIPHRVLIMVSFPFLKSHSILIVIPLSNHPLLVEVHHILSCPGVGRKYSSAILQ